MTIYDVVADFRQTKPKEHFPVQPLPAVAADQIACCLTIYNEPAAALLVSISALMRNVRFMQRERGRTRVHELTLCIIADGQRSLSPSVVEVLTTLGLYHKNRGHEFGDLRVFERMVGSNTVDALLARLDPDDIENSNWLSIHRDSLLAQEGAPPVGRTGSEGEISLRVLACIKKENAGKLNSHCWFFSVLCPAFKPKYCLQMDAGTAPRPLAICRLVESLERDSDLGAAASMILVHSSRGAGGFLHLWQVGDFALQKLMEWPAEMLCGYLTVIPGQFCIFRWSALSGAASSQNGPGAASRWHPQPDSPLERYFRGMSLLGPFESNMFLAEDRILGFEIMAQRNSRWRLYYENTAVAITDSCDSLPELFRQRRRWTNSSFTCNLWLITKVVAYLRNSAAPARVKLRSIVAVPWLSLNMAYQWLLPALVIFFFKQFVDDVGLRAGRDSLPFLAANGTYLAFIGLLVAQVVLFVAAPKRIFGPVFHVFAALQVALFLGSLALPHGLLLVGLCVESVMALLCALIYSRALFGNLVRIIAPYTVLRLAMGLTINIYSLCNLHNCSWGTKGLHAVPGLFTPNKPSAPAPIEVGFYRFRAKVLALWLLSNGLAIGAFYTMPPERLALPFKIVAALLLVFFGVKLVAGLIAVLQFGFKRNQPA